MKIAAIYIEEHEYLFDKPQTINFGAKYLYSFRKEEGNIIIQRTKNKNYINDFFNLTNLKSKLTNINAIVGQNGAGKSTLLDIIRSEFIENQFALPNSQSLFLFESDESENPIIVRNNFNEVYLEDINDGITRIPLLQKNAKSVQTIYYSPHYDYKFNPHFDDVDHHDISFDRILEKDLASLNEKNKNANGWSYSPSQELIFKNSLRQIEFLTSDLVKEQKIFKGLFHFQEHYDPILHFRGYNVDDEEWNTPTDFRRILKMISEELHVEIMNSHTIKIMKNDKVSNQVEINQYILKRNVIKFIVSLLYKQMEKDNSFLEEGYFPYKELQTKLENADAYNMFLIFIENSYLENHKKKYKLFEEETVSKLLSKIYNAIDKQKDKQLVSNTTLRTSKEDAIEILQLQRKFINELNNYYYKFHETNEEPRYEHYKVEEFVNFMPFSRRLSSGENSLLNLFSRIYDFLNSNLKKYLYRELKEHYILLLDEADLTFHLSWKKKYVKSLLLTLPHFFNELDNNPSFQIIFTTHDPLTLSDLPNSNVIYIERSTYENSPNVLNYDDFNRPLKTFGANISDLIADSFFIENSLIGDFAFEKIKECINWLNSESHQKKNYYKQFIELIDEPIVQRKLAEMYDVKMKTDFQKEIIDTQIQKLNDLKKKIKA